MTPFRLTHLPSGEVQEFDADSRAELFMGIHDTAFTTTTGTELPIPVRPLYSTRLELARQINAGEAVATCGDWELREGRKEHLHL